MLPYASNYGLRIFTMNMRDYRDSSPYSPEELADLASTEIEVQASAVRQFGHSPEELADLASTEIEVQASAVRQFGREIAGFIKHVCTTKSIPQVVCDGDRKTGGVVLMTWSMSGLAVLSILGDPDTLESQDKAVLSQYLRKVILYGKGSLPM